MGKTTIEWTDYTWNGWWGCQKVSPGCQHCYAETFSKRVGRNIWGPAATTERWRTKGPWRDVLKWDRKAAAEGVRRKAFCQSMSDFFEDHPQLVPWRVEACDILQSLRWLDIQLLTKRIENVLRMVPPSWLDNWPPHIWIGTSVENQATADERIPHLMKIPAKVRFLSCEPLLGPVDLWSARYPNPNGGFTGAVTNWPGGVQWVIVGGESGHHARPMHPRWARSLLDQCQEAEIPFFFKQWGEWLPAGQFHPNWALSPPRQDLQVMGGDHLVPGSSVDLWKVGKKAAGRFLDGREWNEFPI